MKLSHTRNLVLTALSIALCIVLPMAFHTVPKGGTVFLPMHIPVLLCGLVCAPVYGLACGLLGPLLSCLLTSMPPAAILPAMMLECGIYGLVSSLCLRWIRTGKLYADLYLSLGIAMMAGRILSGIAKALIFTPGITFSAWITASFVTALPGIVLQLALVPLLVRSLMAARVIPMRY